MHTLYTALRADRPQLRITPIALTWSSDSVGVSAMERNSVFSRWRAMATYIRLVLTRISAGSGLRIAAAAEQDSGRSKSVSRSRRRRAPLSRIQLQVLKFSAQGSLPIGRRWSSGRG
jgi:hypothetical protein